MKRTPGFWQWTSIWRLAGAARLNLLLALVFVLQLLTGAGTAQAQTNGSDFDHDSTGFVITGPHNLVRCESCHINGVFKGTPRDCASCHGTTNPRSKIIRLSTHLPSTAPCETCHFASAASFNDAIFTHVEVLPNTCNSCHLGQYPQIPSSPVDATHQSALARGLSCDQCHTISTFSQATVPVNHIPYNGTVSCSNCHVSSDYSQMPAVGAIHANAPAGAACAACHSSAGVAAFAMPTMQPPLVGPPGSHLPMGNQDCATCHVGSGSSIASLPVQAGARFSSSAFSHAGISSGCATCHGPGTSAGAFYGVTSIVQMPSTSGPSATAHIPSGTACESCHLSSLGSVPALLQPQISGNQYFRSAPYPTTSQIHAGIGSGCAACHDTNAVWLDMGLYPKVASGGNYTGFQSRPQAAAGTFNVADNNHPPSGDCSQCHVGISFALAAVGKPANHIPVLAGASCGTCHTSGDYALMPTISAIHQNAPVDGNTNCAQCHSAANAAKYAMTTMSPAIVAPPPTHIGMASLDCAACHVGSNSSLNVLPVQSGASFGNSAFSHATLAQPCAACHAAGAGPFYGVTPKSPATLTPQHVPFAASVGCDTCHTNNIPSMLVPAGGASNGATTFAGGHFSHTGVSTGCVSCHGPTLSGSSFYGVPGLVVMPPVSTPVSSSHLPTSTTCENCHVAPSAPVTSIGSAPGSGFQTPAPSTSQVHAGVTGNCASCHDTNFTWMSVSAYPISLAAPYSGFQTRPQASQGTQFVADASHPVSGECSNCHAGFLFFTGPTKPANHIPTTAGCTMCHTSSDYSVLPTLDAIHANAPTPGTNCAQCHSSANAALYAIPAVMPNIVSPPANHVDMGTLGCEVCHVGSNSSLVLPVQSGARFSNSAFSHNGLVKACADCHGASVAPGSFYGVVVKNIASLAPAHVPTTLACNSCHLNTPTGLVPLSGGGTTYSFAGAAYVHTGITSGCSACHDSTITNNTFYGLPGIVVMPPSATPATTSHMPTGNACENCHTVPSGVLTSFGSAPGSGFKSPSPTPTQIHNGVSGNCSSCHDTNDTWMSVGVYPAFATATAPALYEGFQTRPLISGVSGPFSVVDAGHPVAGDCSQCHGSLVAFSAPSMPSNHIPVAAGSSCANCHDVSNYASMPTLTTIHQYAPSRTTNCVQCHSSANAATYAMATMVPPIVAPASNHIAMGSLSCESCHLASLPPQTGSTFANASFSHSGITGNCATCHDASVTSGTFQGANFVPRTNSLTPAHVPIMTPLDCVVCHTSNIPATPVPAGGATAGMTTFAGGKFSHTGLTWGCADCHGPTISGGSFYGISGIVVMPPATTPGPNSHMPTSTTCENCHAGSIPAALVAGNAAHAAPGSGFAAPAPSSTLIHAGITANCASCHEANDQWMSVTTSPSPYPPATVAPFTGFQTRPTLAGGAFSYADAAHPAAGDCANCHGNFSDFTAPSKPANHIPTATTAACASCHTSADYSAMPALPAIHQYAPSTSGNCAQCHSAAAATQYAMASMSPALKGPVTGHMDMGTLDCSACHVGASPFNGTGTFANSGFSHSGFTGNCAECHGVVPPSAGAAATSVSFSGTATLTPMSASGLSPAHVPSTLDCVSCHTPVPAAVIPNAYNNSTGQTFAGGQFSHTGMTTGCNACHLSGTGPFKGVSLAALVQVAIPGGSTSTGAGSSSTHLPTVSTACENCHIGSLPGTAVAIPASYALGSTLFKTPNPTSAVIHNGTSGICATCHEQGDVWVSVGQYPITQVSPFQGFQTRPATSALTAFTLVDSTPHPAPSTGDCSKCHASLNDFTSTAKPSNHIPTSATAACTACHTSPDYSVMPAANWDLIHQNTPVPGSNCAQCHSAANATAYDTSILTIKPPTSDHMSMGTLDCASCHTTTHASGSTSSFSNASFIHSGLTVACASCHSTVGGQQIAFSGATPSLPKIAPANHVPNPASLGCDVCHTTPAVVVPFGNSPSVASFGGGKFSHSSITSACASCHQGTTGSSYYGIAAIASLPATLTTTPGSSNHIPVTTACESCHLAAVPATALAMPTSVTLGSTLFKTPAPTTAQIHGGISGSCATCHEAGSVWLDSTLYPPSSTVFTAGATYTGFITRPAPTQNASGNGVVDGNHPALSAGDCSKCHGSTADFDITAKPANHIPTLATATCVSCHTQMGSTNDFSVLPAWSDIHNNAPTPGSNCAQCHSAANAPTYAIAALGYTVKAPSANHVPLAGSTACETCHVGTGSSIAVATSIGTGASFNGSSYSHSGITTGCATCHGSGISGSSFANIPYITAIAASTTAMGTSTHIPYSAPCESCHLSNVPTGQNALPSGAVSVASGTTGFKLTLSAALNSAVHSGVTSCGSCHEKDNEWLGMSLSGFSPPTTTGTGTAATYSGWLTRPYASPATANGIADSAHASGSLATADCSQCHAVGTSFSAAAQPAGHMPTTTSTCSSCHPTAGDYGTTTLGTLANLHTGVTDSVTKLTTVAAVSNTSCVACHTAWTAGTANRAPFAGCTTLQASCASPPPVTYQPALMTKVGTHVPIGTLDCSACHSSEASFASTLMGATGHSNATTGGDKCLSCHESTMAAPYWTNVVGASGQAFQVRPGSHTGSKAAPNDCSGCHSFGTKFASSVKPSRRSAGVNPDINRLRPIAQNGLGGRGQLGNSFNHQGVMVGQCKSCHDGQHATGLPPRHLMVLLSCDSCHRTSSWTPAQFSHAGVPANTCMNCHNGLSASAKPAGHFITVRSCDSCHKTSGWLPVTYSHLSPAYQQGAGPLMCVSCHVTNSEVIPHQMRGATRGRPTGNGP